MGNGTASVENGIKIGKILLSLTLMEQPTSFYVCIINMIYDWYQLLKPDYHLVLWCELCWPAVYQSANVSNCLQIILGLTEHRNFILVFVLYMSNWCVEWTINDFFTETEWPQFLARVIHLTKSRWPKEFSQTIVV